MFRSIQLRLVTVLCAIWFLGLLLWPTEYLTSAQDIGILAAVGWVAIAVGVFGTFWVLDSPGINLPSIPRWLAVVLIAIGIVLAMTLPKALLH